MKTISLAIVALLTLAGCGGGSDGSRVEEGSGDSPTSSASSRAAQPTPKRVIAAIEQLRPVVKAVTVTEDNDPNDLIGRPNGYEAATVFYDRRVSCDSLEVECGATLEVWPDAAGARRRSTYIQRILKASPMLGAEYHHRTGRLLLRVWGDLKPSEDAAYEAAFRASTSG